MVQLPLYLIIADDIRQEIVSGKIKTGEKLPSIREMKERWDCTNGTVQRAYHHLAEQGLVNSRSGQGTHVLSNIPNSSDFALRRANLVNRAQSFLLEYMSAGYTPEEIESAVRIALDQWRVISETRPQVEADIIRCSGSHDLALAWIAAHFQDIAPGFSLKLSISGSLGGLIALAEGNADLAGCHLWDQETGEFNLSFVKRLLPGRRVCLLTLVWRYQGLIISPGNPKGLTSLADLIRSDVRFLNRQPGSGTRVWLDSALHREKLNPAQIHGYEEERRTHTEVAREVAEGGADVGFGLQNAARAFGLDFIPLLRERYDLVIPENYANNPAVEQLKNWLLTSAAQTALFELGGYDTTETGSVIWVN